MHQMHKLQKAIEKTPAKLKKMSRKIKKAVKRRLLERDISELKIIIPILKEHLNDVSFAIHEYTLMLSPFRIAQFFGAKHKSIEHNNRKYTKKEVENILIKLKQSYIETEKELKIFESYLQQSLSELENLD